VADERDILIAKLIDGLEAARADNERLRALVAKLEARLGQNSSNSSKPPSTDGPGAARPGKGSSGRKKGGQPGHKHHRRTLLPPDKVTSSADRIPKCCRRCGEKLTGRDPSPLLVQSLELPAAAPNVHEERLHRLGCGQCGTKTCGQLPAGFTAYGPRLRAMLGMLTGRYRLSKREAKSLLASMLGVELSLGSVSNVERSVSGDLAAVVEEARTFVREQRVVHPDETGWREARERAWLWTAVSESVTVFQIAQSRGGKVAQSLLGEDFGGFVVSDRWSGYNWLELRQLCWSHLKRDVQGFVDRGGVGAEIGRQLQVEIDKMFRWYSRVRDGTLDRTTFQRRMKPVESRIERLFDDARTRAEGKTRGMANEIFGQRHFLFTFVDNDFVEPTNNAAERAIRPAVLWRKGSFGTDSPNGSRFVERMLSVVATLKQQGRDLLGFLMGACRGHAVSLLPLPGR
jgi:transposase